MRRTPNRGEGIVTYFALVNKSGKSTLISELIYFLASDSASFITGGLYLIDGGLVAG